MEKLYKCRCDYIINEEEKESLKGKGQLPDPDCCFGCDSPFRRTRKIIDRIKYQFKNHRLW